MSFKPKIATSYLDDIYYLNSFREVVRVAESSIRSFAKKFPFEAIAFTGTSGSALAFPLSLRLSKRLICIRKGRSHTRHKVEGCMNAPRYIIVDDCIDTGDTIRKIAGLVKEMAWPGSNPKLVGIYLYADGTTRKYFTVNRRRVPII